MRITHTTAIVRCLCLIFVLSDFAPAQARPLYQKVFLEVYPDLKNADVSKCAICHTGTDKKNRNDYGKAVGEALGGTNIKDADTIKAALKKAEDKLPTPKKK